MVLQTLAAGRVNMSHVLQHSCDTELHLFQEDKDRTKPVAMVMVMSLSSQPVDHLDRRQNVPADVGWLEHFRVFVVVNVIIKRIKNNYKNITISA